MDGFWIHLVFPIFVKVFTSYEFYLKNHPSDFKIIYTKKLQIFFSIFWYNLNFFKANFYEFYLKKCLSDFKIIYTKKLQIFFSIFWYNLKNFKPTFLIYMFLFLVKVFAFYEFYLKNRPLDFKIIYTKKLKIFFFIFDIIFKKFKPTFSIYVFPFFVKVFTFMNFISRTVHQILKSFMSKNCKYFSLFFDII